MNGAGKFLQLLNRFEMVVAVTALFVSAGALLSDIFAREFFSVGLFGSFRVAVYATAISALIGFCVCISSGSHLRISFLDKAAPERLRPLVMRIGDLMSFAICAYFAYWAVFYVRQTAGLGETDPSLGIEVWPFQAVMAWMFISAAARYLIYFIFPTLAATEQEIPQ
ncbi:MAG TPA: TRAP transporter small permease [Rhizobiaceae bacterium]|nr:TRAP transporter small permease [Rhizobiaceae bacterium]